MRTQATDMLLGERNIQNSNDNLIVPLDSRISSEKGKFEENSPFLFEQLKKLFTDNANQKAADSVDDFVKGGQRNLMTCSSSIANMMMEVKKIEEGENLPVYAMLKENLCSAIVSNGIKNSFFQKMFEPEKPEEW